MLNFIRFSEGREFDLAILIKEAGLKEDQIYKHYLLPLKAQGVDIGRVIAFSLEYDGKKPSAACAKAYLSDVLLPTLAAYKIKNVLCCDAEYFKKLIKQTKAEALVGYKIGCRVEGYENINVFYGINYQQYFYNPDIAKKTDLAVTAIGEHLSGAEASLGKNILKDVSYPSTLAEIKAALDSLLNEPFLTADIEAFSLKHYSAGIGSLSLSKNQHHAVAFLCDYVPVPEYEVMIYDKKDKKDKPHKAYGVQKANPEVYALIKDFLCNYKGCLMWHNVTYDAYVLIYVLWMKDLLDQEGMLEGIEVMTRNFDCTQLITYLATNTCAGNKLGLKEQSFEFAGNYAEDVKDIRLLPVERLLPYNAIDTCCTWFTYNKNHPIMVNDLQLPIYNEVFKPAVSDIIQMQLTGMCLDMDEVLSVKATLTKVCEEAIAVINASPKLGSYLKDAKLREQEKNYQKRLRENKHPENVRRKPLEDINVSFNPNSGPQIAHLLFDTFKLPILDLTDKKAPATGGKTLKKLLNHTKDPDTLAVLESLLNFALANKILTTFIVSFKSAPLAKDGHYYLFGSFKLGGTVSGRLSSSNPK